MKKVLSKILILFIIFANLFAPLSVGLSKNNNIEVKSSKAEAGWILDGTGDNPITITTDFSTNDTSIKINVDVFWPEIGYLTSESIHVLKLSDPQTDPLKTTYDEDKIVPLTSNSVAGHQVGYVEFTGLTSLKTYKFTVRATQNSTSIFQSYLNTVNTVIYTIIPIATSSEYLLKNTGEVQNPTPYEIITSPAGATAYVSQKVDDATVKNAAAGATALPACSTGYFSFDVGGCLAQGVYYLFFKPSSFVFGLAGKALDFTLMYSISDTSYRSSFVVEGWGIVKDFCNMFFIFVLLYIAFGTILGLQSVKTKEMIINVVIIGLLINFSLFTTQVIIDASNILTRVFYNQKTIVTGTAQKDALGNPLPVVSQLGDFKEIKLSEAIISKVNPQELIMNAGQVESVPIKGSMNEGSVPKTTNPGVSTGTFIIVVLLATAVNVVGTIAFLSSALIFIGRVVMLWLAMILAPLAFFSYIVPQLQDIKMIGWKHWWSDTLNMAFVAPVFAFFMYIIVGFMDKGLGIIDASTKTGKGGLTFVIAIVVPFAFIMILLMKAKDIAVKMSGEIGEAMSKAGAAVGGIALGAATGGAAFAMRGTIGAMGTKLGESQWAKQNRFTRAIGDAGKWTGTKTFDARNTDLGKKAAKGMGIEGDIGKAKEGGYTKYKADVQKKREETAKSLEVGHDEELMHKQHAAEEASLALKNVNSKELDALTGKIPVAQQDVVDKTNRANSLKDDASTAGILAYTDAKKDLAKAVERVKNLKEDKQNISDGGLVMKRNPATGDLERDDDGKPIPKGDGTYHTTNGKMTAKEADKPVMAARENSAAAELEAAQKEEFAALIEADATYTQAEKDIARTDAENARSLANTARTNVAAAVETRRTTETGKSINDLDFTDIPDAKHEISTENSRRKNAYAEETENRWFNKSANKHAAHNIRMNAEIKSDGKGGH